MRPRNHKSLAYQWTTSGSRQDNVLIDCWRCFHIDQWVAQAIARHGWLQSADMTEICVGQAPVVPSALLLERAPCQIKKLDESEPPRNNEIALAYRRMSCGWMAQSQHRDVCKYLFLFNFAHKCHIRLTGIKTTVLYAVPITINHAVQFLIFRPVY